MNVHVVILLVVVAYVDAECGILERFKIKHQWRRAFGVGEHRLKFSLHLWHSFFRENRDAVSLFKRVRGDNVYSPEFLAHASRVITALDMVICILDDPLTLNSTLNHLRIQHTQRNIKPNYFDEFGLHLFDMLGEELELEFDFDAWQDCYRLIISGIKP